MFTLEIFLYYAELSIVPNGIELQRKLGRNCRHKDDPQGDWSEKVFVRARIFYTDHLNPRGVLEKRIRRES